MNAKKFLKMGVCACAAFVAIAAESAVEVGKVIIRQQWPWSTDVKIEYTLQHGDVVKPVDVKVEAFNGSEKLDQEKLESALVGDRIRQRTAISDDLADVRRRTGRVTRRHPVLDAPDAVRRVLGVPRVRHTHGIPVRRPAIARERDVVPSVVGTPVRPRRHSLRRRHCWKRLKGKRRTRPRNKQ